MKRLIFALPATLFAAIALYLALGLGRDPHLAPSALIDRPAPEFALPPLPGRERGIRRDDLLGEAHLVNVFASWCAQCRIEQPVLLRLARERGVPVYGLNWKDQPAEALAWLQRFGDPFRAIGADLSGRVALDWGVYGAPETFVVDADARIRYRHVGPLTPEDIDTKIYPLIKELNAVRNPNIKKP
ncbi:Thiol:disulfide interchange protein DsbE [Azospirillaceae bacterium]